MIKRIKGFFVFVAVLVAVAIQVMLFATFAMADGLVFPTIALTDVGTIAAGMLGLLGAVWALKKALGFLGTR